MLEEKSAPQKKGASFGGFLGGFGAAIVVVAGGFVVWQHQNQLGAPSNSQPSVSANTSASHSAASLAALVADETAQLEVKPHAAVLATDEAMTVADSIRHGDYQTADRLSKDVLLHSTLQAWSFRPFNLFMGSLTLGDDPQLLENLNAWVLHDPGSALAHLIRAQYYQANAWATRGEDSAETVSSAHMQEFRDDLRAAQDDVRKSIALNPNIPYSYYLWLKVVSGNSNSPDMETAFQAGITRYPGYYELYRVRLYSLTPKWGGSARAMTQFVEQYAGKASEASPLKLLYLQMSAYLLDAAWIDCS
jgi:hypothetical protein